MIRAMFPSFLQWFGFYRSGQAKETLPLKETTLFKEVTEGERCYRRLSLELLGSGRQIPALSVLEYPEPTSHLT